MSEKNTSISVLYWKIQKENITIVNFDSIHNKAEYPASFSLLMVSHDINLKKENYITYLLADYSNDL